MTTRIEHIPPDIGRWVPHSVEIKTGKSKKIEVGPRGRESIICIEDVKKEQNHMCRVTVRTGFERHEDFKRIKGYVDITESPGCCSYTSFGNAQYKLIFPSGDVVKVDFRRELINSSQKTTLVQKLRNVFKSA